MIRSSQRLIFIVLGWFFVALGMIGMFLPLLPTTPFALLAAFCFSRGSERMHQWLLSQPGLGPLIIQWQKHRVIEPRAKLISTVMIVPLFSYSIIFVPVHPIVKAIILCTGICVLTFIWTRKSRPDGCSP